MKLTFLGATQTVTGSKYLLEFQNKKVLIDCGLFQGYKELRLRNWNPLPIDPSSIDAIIVTHAHIDHSGYIPLLVKQGFKGNIYCSHATKDLCQILLPDSGHLQEEDARRANKYKYTKHKKALPLYTEKEARATFKQFVPCEFGQPISIEELSVTFHHAGHILGAASLEIKGDQSSLLFSGDLGRPNDPVLKAPDAIPQTDYIVMESTYGNRLHDKEDTLIALERVINQTVAQDGSILIPSFAVGRAQSLLYFLYQLKAAKRIPEHIPIYLDSPMAVNASKLMCKYHNELRLTTNECKHTCNVAHYIQSVEESKGLNFMPQSKIIISASGMATGGRVLHHLKNMLPSPKNTVLFAGFQAGGTRGARLVSGETELKMFGEMVPVRAKVDMISSLSAHADYEELLTWLRPLKQAPKGLFITHGESQASESLQSKIKDSFGWDGIIPNYMDSIELEGRS